MPDTLDAQPDTAAPAPAQPRRERAPAARPKQQPPYAVLLHNDELNGFDYVVGTLCKVFHYSTEKAYKLTLTAHFTGRACVWSGMKEHAELKADQLRSCGPDPQMRDQGAGKLRVSIEPQPG